MPTVLSLYWNRLSSTGVFWGILTAFVLGVPLFVYGNYKGIVWISVVASIDIIAITAIFAFLFPRKIPFDVEKAKIDA
ncbi:hypothetical protein HY213_00305 [Candidatus Peregrinibacteria bacterium]|nr:hypothetical protein [Candidatus Peregrinibacteria bacterium]